MDQLAQKVMVKRWRLRLVVTVFDIVTVSSNGHNNEHIFVQNTACTNGRQDGESKDTSTESTANDAIPTLAQNVRGTG
jgi:hypothetical protein